jgi:hypothetical protein
MSTQKNKALFSGLVLAGLALFVFSLSLPVQAAPAFQLTPFPTPTPGADGRIIYIVQPNDTLLRISLISGVPIEEIRALNNFTGDNIQLGQELLLGLAGPSLVTPTAGPGPTSTAVQPTSTPPPGFGLICIALFEDENGDSLRQEDTESIIRDGAISVADRSGAVSLTAVTDGSFDEENDTDAECFNDLIEGDFTVTVAVPEGMNPTTVTSYALDLKAGDRVFIGFGAQPNSETVAQVNTQEGGNARPMLGIVGGALLLAGAGLAIFAGRLLRGK